MNFLRYPALDLRRIPFSLAGSFLTVNQGPLSEPDWLRLNTVRRTVTTPRWQSGTDWSHEITDIVLIAEGRRLTPTINATPEKIELNAGDANVSIIFADAESLLFRARHCAVQFLWRRTLTWIHRPATDLFFGYDSRSQYYLTLATDEKSRVEFLPASGQGADRIEDSLVVRGEDEFQFTLRLTVQENRVRPPRISFSDAGALREKEIQAWQQLRPAAPHDYTDTAKTAWHLFWNLQVSSSGGYTRQSILSSKRAMSMVWSWDNCFNALAVAGSDPKLAWDQLFLVLDHQRKNGLLPDCVNDALGSWGFNKPPIFSFVAGKLLAQTPLSDRAAYATEIYPKLVSLQKWWLRERDLTGTGLIYYMHGNDSGWDNASIFDERGPVASPDLCTYLILGAEALAELAIFAGHAADADHWRGQASHLVSFFHERFVDGDEIVYHVLTPEGPVIRKGSQSLLTRLPILLGHRLAPSVRSRLVSELLDEKTFLSPFGPASEALNSPHYAPNGYWRGPIWGPSTYLIFEGLLAAGGPAAAREIATRFCKLCSLTATFSENYNAKTGEGQYDSGMTWSAADFILLASWLAENPSNPDIETRR